MCRRNTKTEGHPVTAVDRCNGLFNYSKNLLSLDGTIQTYRMKSTCSRSLLLQVDPEGQHWMPTREAWVKAFLPLCPKNLVIRFSAPMVDQSRHKLPKEWKNTSTVSSDLNKTFLSEGHFCPAPKQNNECGDCRACWDARVKNVVYGKH